MEIIKSLWNFFQSQILKMKWLSEITDSVLSVFGLERGNPIRPSIHFFIYDLVKITLLLCVIIFLISYIQSYFPPERSKRILGRFHGVGANCLAALLGTVTPFCSCSSIPLFIGFTSAGLPLGITFSFLISSPMVDLASFFLLTGVFGLKIAAVYVIIGLAVAVAGGTLIEKLHMEKYVEDIILNAKGSGIKTTELKKRNRLIHAKERTLSILKNVFPYILIGVGIGAIIHNIIPEKWVVAVLGSNNPFGVVLATIVGAPMYADIFGIIPVAEALFYKGAMLGSILAFMMAVTTLSLPSIIMLRKAVKPKLLALFVGICVVGIIIVGYLFNIIQFYII
ncbi:MAG: putative permease [Firmicutes bacterium ADurb.Bin193]|nr:MAG: putative permease [Firmicutes bacterium ADurb.Bin193]